MFFFKIVLTPKLGKNSKLKKSNFFPFFLSCLDGFCHADSKTVSKKFLRHTVLELSLLAKSVSLYTETLLARSDNSRTVCRRIFFFTVLESVFQTHLHEKDEKLFFNVFFQNCFYPKARKKFKIEKIQFFSFFS